MADAAVLHPDIDFEARDHVHDVVEASGTSFLSAMKILPEERREAMFAIYAFCREIDDIADEPAAPSEKISRLAHWRKEIDRLYAGQPELLTSRALLHPVRAFGLEKQDFLDLIDGMEMDAVEDIRAPSFRKLEQYCDRVASAVGRLSVKAFGSKDGKSRDVARHLGQALQLTNILRDLKEDAERGRLYLPKELLEAHGINTAEPLEVLAHPALPDVCMDLAKVAKERFREARAALHYCKRRPMRPATMMMYAYKAILDRLIRRGFKTLDEEVTIPTWRKIWIVLRHGIV